MWRLAQPENLVWLWLLPTLWILEIIIRKYFSLKINKYFKPEVLEFLTLSKDPKKNGWKKVLTSLVLILIILAWARPQAGQSKTEIKSEGVEIILAVDVSESMLAEDLRPSRLEQAKSELTKLVDLLGGHKVGLIAFAGSAHLQSPLTNDPSALKMYIESLATTSVSVQGTNFTEALDEAKLAFDRGGVGSTGDESASAVEDSKATRVIIVASDGEDQEPGALDKAKELAKKGIHIFTIAYGTEKGAPIPERDNMGYLRSYKKDKSGNTVLTQVKGQMLQDLAKSGQGSFYFASFGGTHMKELSQDLDKLEKTQFESQVATQYEEKFQIFLLFAFLISLIEILINRRRNLTDFFKHHWRGRFVSPKEDVKGIRKSTTLSSLFFLFLGITVGVNFRMYAGESKDISLQDSNALTDKYEQKKQTTAVSDLIEDVQSIHKINKGSKALKEDKTAEAESYFLQALKSKKLSSIALNNLGVSYLKQGLPDKAIAAFTESLQVAQSAQEKFIGNFNLGVVHHLGKHKEEAIQYYRKALDIDSSSKELKTNIELLLNDQQQNGKDGGEGDSKDNDKDNKNDQNKDKNKDKEQDGKDNKDDSDKKDDSDGKDSKDKNKQNNPDEENKKYKSNKPQPKPFESKDLSPSDVNKILGELKQQEQKIRADYNKREVKEKPKDKDW